MTEPVDDAGAAFTIFLNYRRKDADMAVGRLWDTLRNGIEEVPGFGEQQIFRDIDTIEPGVDFRDAIQDAVAASDVFLAVIGPDWLNAVDAKGRRRLDNPNDFVRVEIEAALRRAAEHHDVRVVPTLVENAEMPAADELPEALAALPNRQAVSLTNAHWPYEVERLLASLKKLEREKLGRFAEQADREAAARAAADQAEREAADRAAWEQQRAAQQPEHRRDPRRPRPRLSPTWSRGVWVAGGAAVLAVAAAVALIASLADDGSGTGTQTTPTSPPASWRQVRAPAGVELLRGIRTYAGDRIIGVGDDGRHPTVVVSDGGVLWKEETVQGGIGTMHDVAVSEQAAVAAGSLVDAPGDVDGEIWRRSEERWTRVCHNRACGDAGRPVEPSAQRIFGLTVTPGGSFVAVGEDKRGGRWDAAVWFSQDGRAWERRAADDPDLGGDLDQVMKGVAAIGNRIVAVGWNARRGAVWISDDEGRSWTRAHALPRTSRTLRLFAVAAPTPSRAQASSRIVAVGSEVDDGENAAVAWFSVDGGLTWRRAVIPNAGYRGQQMVDVVPVPSGWVAVGNDHREGRATSVAALWRSRDGTTWASVSADAFEGAGGRSMTSAAALPGDVIAVGSETLPGAGASGRIWISEQSG